MGFLKKLFEKKAKIPADLNAETSTIMDLSNKKITDVSTLADLTNLTKLGLYRNVSTDGQMHLLRPALPKYKIT